MWFMIIIVLLMIVCGGLAYLANLKGSYTVSRSRLFKEDAEVLFDKIVDLKSWPSWSPWLMHEPDAKLEYSENYSDQNGFYRWNGQLIGAGTLTQIRLQSPHSIEQQIEFSRPFKSVADVSFEIAEVDGQTEVTWTMKGVMPFLFRFLTEKTVAMISKDYDLGLAMLAGHLDPAEEYPRIEFHGSTEMPPQSCLCLAFEGGIEALKSTMDAEFPALVDYLLQQQPISAPPLTVYHRVDPVKMHFVCDMAVPVSGVIDVGRYQLRQVGGGRYFKISLQGKYDFLELAWYAAMSHLRMQKIKIDRSRPCLEVYENDPRQLASTNDCLTSLYIPI